MENNRQTLLIETVMGQTRLAVIENGALCELYCERASSENLTGNLYLGRVMNVLPGMNAAFVDIGLDKNAFLAADDVLPELGGDTRLVREFRERRIEKLVRPGQELLVQVTRAATGQKGPRVSNTFSLPGRTMVLLPDVRYVGVSKKITDAEERDRLHAVGRALTGETDMGVILRTASAGVDRDALEREFSGLRAAWREITVRAGHDRAPKCVYSDSSLALQAVRDRLSEQTEALWTEDAGQYAALRELAELYAPQWIDRIRLHESTLPLFDIYRVDDQADQALRKYVWLKSGGSLVIEETEALTVIDVNTGKFTGRKALEETIYKNNCEAAREIMRQLRLRDLGGIIIVDFIDMKAPEQREQLLELLRELSRQDHNRVGVAGMTSLGLVEMTRKRQRQSLSRQLSHICSACGGNGTVPSHETIACSIQRDIWRRRRAGECGALLVEATEPVAGWLSRLGVPSGGAVYLAPARFEKDADYRVSPADTSRLPGGARLLK